jgi:hypothetical protein
VRGLTPALSLCLAAMTIAAPARAADPPPQAAAQYEHEKKSVALAVTLEAISPIAGVGGFYAGDSEHATVLAVVSGTALVVGAGSLLWLLHLEDQHAGGFGRVELDAEQGSAITLLVVAGVAYLMARISGLALAPDATHIYNDELRARLGLPPPEPVIPFHALAPVPTLTFRF